MILRFTMFLVFSLMSLGSFAEEETAERSVYYTIEPAFVSNFGISERKMHYVKAEVSLKIENEQVLQQVKSNLPLIRHEMVMLLSSQSKESMEQQDAQESIRVAALGKVKEALARELGSAGVEDLFFTSFVVQL